MTNKVAYVTHKLQYIKPARTSRGEMQTHTVYYIKFQQGTKTAYGEAAPLPGLSIDFRDDFEEKVRTCCELVNDGLSIDALDLEEFPSLQFAFETAQLAWQQDMPFTLFQTEFLQGKGIPINGLVWMDNEDAMLQQAFDKIEQGFTCIKFKVGALDFDAECRMLETLRKQFNAFKIEIRLDANGAFKPDDALQKLKELSRFDVHSIEQPVKQKQQEVMEEICAKSPVPIALDEELIGIDAEQDGLKLLKSIRPQYIILKPTLLGGLAKSEKWINYANTLNIGWWATSALESNIGLNAIAQWTAKLRIKLPQGLGTGGLYTNNVSSPLEVKNGKLFYNQSKPWNTLPG